MCFNIEELQKHYSRAVRKDHTAYDLMYTKCAEEATLQRQRVDSHLCPGQGWEATGVTATGTGFLLEMMKMFHSKIMGMVAQLCTYTKCH